MVLTQTYVRNVLVSVRFAIQYGRACVRARPRTPTLLLSVIRAMTE